MPNVDTTVLGDIQEVNLSYLMLAQRLLRENYAAGMYRLGFDSDVADIVLARTFHQQSDSNVFRPI
ncbi:flagellar transcriptional regulator FlhD [Alcaligenaceae bacterium LG-2]|uniref:Flagellar transcriptional regulator FlhD n=1 Tax=Yanghanlia caeni TaxID=3064283 RepID=A0ABU1D925_9BURK|nr:flagellar transcriptional regulator FlhD [Alcaligenaceae bacterium LG-2]